MKLVQGTRKAELGRNDTTLRGERTSTLTGGSVVGGLNDRTTSVSRSTAARLLALPIALAWVLVLGVVLLREDLPR